MKSLHNQKGFTFLTVYLIAAVATITLGVGVTVNKISENLETEVLKGKATLKIAPKIRTEFKSKDIDSGAAEGRYSEGFVRNNFLVLNNADTPLKT